MFDYLNKFKNLSADIKKVVDSDEALALIEELEGKYKVELASVVMKVVVKEIDINNLPLYFFTEFALSQDLSENLAEELKKKIFYKIADYLGIETTVDEEGLNLQKDLELLAEERNELREEMDEDLEDQEFLDDYIKSDYLNKIKEQANQVFKILNFNFSSEKKEKFIFYLEKYFKGIIDKTNLRQYLTKPIELGGFGLTDKMLDNILMIADNLKNEEYQEVKSQIKLDKNVLEKINRLGVGTPLIETKNLKTLKSPQTSPLLSPIDSPHLLSASDTPHLAEKTDEEIDKNNSQEDLNIDNELSEKLDLNFKKIEEEALLGIDKHLHEDVSNIADESDDAEKQISKKIENRVMSEEPKEEKPESIPSVFRGPSQDDLVDGNKIKMTDVKKVKIMTPVDEIRYLDLINFRRLSKNPKEALEKIREKLKVLEGLDYTKMIEGIKAWRQSPVHKLYLKMFLEVSNRGISLDQVISEFESEAKDFLKKEEIDAIIEFNKSLRF